MHGVLHPLLTFVLPVVAIALAGLLVLASRAAIRELHPQGGGPKGAAGNGKQSGAWSERPAVTVGRAAAELSSLTGAARQIDAVPLLVVVGAGTEIVRRTVPELGSEELQSVTQALPRGDVSIALGPDGAVASFADGLLGSERWEARWAEFLEAMARMRRDQPFDSLVVMIPAADLAGPARLGDEQLTTEGERLYHIIWSVQRASGWRVPIQLVIHGCNDLIGFDATAQRLPPQTRSAVLGWSVPFGLDTVFERRWVSEGIDALVGRLSAVQARLLMQAQDIEEAEQLLLFPQGVASLAEPLSVLLVSALRQSAYHQPFMFRGLYLIGRAAADGAGAAAPATDVFAARLFRERIFPEHVLCQPIEGARTWRRRRIRLAQAALALLVVIGLFGMTRVRDHGATIETIRRLVLGIGAITAENQESGSAQVGPAQAGSGATAAAVPPAGNLAATDQLLRLMAGVSRDHLETVWAPLSFIGGASGEVERAIRAGYESVVLPTVYDRLTEAIPTLLGVAAVPENIPPQACAAGDATAADIDRLRHLLNRLEIYAMQLRAYHSLSQSPRIGTLASLLQFSLGVTLPAGFTENYHLYEAGLEGAVEPPLPITAIRRSVDLILAQQFSRALDASYPASALARAVSGAVNDAGMPQTPSANEMERLRRLDAELKSIADNAPQAEYAWVGGTGPSAAVVSFLPRIDALAAEMPGAPDLAPVDATVPAVLASEAQDCLGQTRTRLVAARLFGALPVLAVDGGATSLSAAMSPALQALDGFLALRLASAAPPAPESPLATPDVPLFWDTQGLLSLQDMAEGYLTFRAQNLPGSLPSLLNQEIEEAAGRRLDGLALAAVAEAEERGSERSGGAPSAGTALLRDEIARFAAAAPVLTGLRVALSQAGQTGASDRLDTLLSNQATRLLGRVDALLTSADPYQLVDGTLSFWSGTPPLAAPAFGAATLADLVSTLPARRDYIEALSQGYAAPLVAYLEQSGVVPTGASAALLSRWKGIAAALARYHRGDPSNSLSQLEQFISADMDHISLANCQDLAATGAVGSDWFAETLQNIRRAIAERCAAIRHGDAVAGYEALATSFNQTLAGRFPFGPPSAPDAYPGDVKRFFLDYGPTLAALQSELTAIPAYVQTGAAQFVGALVAVQTALAPMLSDPAPNAPLSYEVAVDFRTNRGADPGADQVAEASLRFGAQSLSSFGATSTLAWTAGQNVELGVRWADDAPSEPVPAAAGRPLVSGRVATFDADGPWSLLRLIMAQRPDSATLAQLSDRQPETLEFVVPLQPNPNAAAGGVGGLDAAKLFMRFALTAILHTPGQPDKRQPVALPPFPGAAPLP
jgi:type VI secretion system protein ImpL